VVDFSPVFLSLKVYPRYYHKLYNCMMFFSLLNAEVSILPNFLRQMGFGGLFLTYFCG